MSCAMRGNKGHHSLLIDQANARQFFDLCVEITTLLSNPRRLLIATKMYKDFVCLNLSNATPLKIVGLYGLAGHLSYCR